MSAPLGTLAFMLSVQPELADRPIVDRTGLSRHYSFTLKWTPESRGAAVDPTNPSLEVSGPSLFTALREQLGLRLVPTKAPVDVLVIETIERPSAN